jgi:hypothetical protein
LPSLDNSENGLSASHLQKVFLSSLRLVICIMICMILYAYDAH